MIVVDTNVWSETLRPSPHSGVLAWLAQNSEQVHMPVTTVHELRYGIELLPAGHRKAALAEQIERMLHVMDPRVLPYDVAAARIHADLRARARTRGHEPSAEDWQIAAITRAAGARLATRNTTDFTGLGVEVIDPWVFRCRRSRFSPGGSSSISSGWREPRLCFT